jgi:hypothetical protein
MDALAAWILTMTLTRDDIRTGGVFATEKQCTDTGADWYRRTAEFAQRKGTQKPKGWLCMETDAKPVETST